MALFGLNKSKPAAVADKRQVALAAGTVAVSRQIDCLGDSCPRPQLMTKKALREAAVGEVIEVLVDNPSSVEALPPMCDELDATHLETVKGDHCWQVYIRKD